MRSSRNVVPDVAFLTSGRVRESDRELAERAVREVLTETAATSAQVTLTVLADEQLPRPALAQTYVDLGGPKVRAGAAGSTVREAVEAMRDRLALRLGHRPRPR